MTITGAIVLFAVIWFMTLYISLPLGMRSQGDEGEVAPGTPASAPATFDLRRKLRRTTLITLPLWALVTSVITWGPFTVQQLDFFSGIEPAWRAGHSAESRPIAVPPAPVPTPEAAPPEAATPEAAANE